MIKRGDEPEQKQNILIINKINFNLLFYHFSVLTSIIE